MWSLASNEEYTQSYRYSKDLTIKTDSSTPHNHQGTGLRLRSPKIFSRVNVVLHRFLIPYELLQLFAYLASRIIIITKLNFQNI